RPIGVAEAGARAMRLIKFVSRNSSPFTVECVSVIERWRTGLENFHPVQTISRINRNLHTIRCRTGRKLCTLPVLRKVREQSVSLPTHDELFPDAARRQQPHNLPLVAIARFSTGKDYHPEPDKNVLRYLEISTSQNERPSMDKGPE